MTGVSSSCLTDCLEGSRQYPQARSAEIIDATQFMDRKPDQGCNHQWHNGKEADDN